MSNKKWLPKAKGIEISGLGILVAIVAPTITCGVSSTVYYDILASDSMSNIFITILLCIFSLLIYLFYLWKSLKDDYDPNKIFTFGFLTFFAQLVGLVIGLIIGNIWYWTSLVSFIIAFALLVKKEEYRLYEMIESATPGIIAFHLAIFAYGALAGDTSSIILTALMVVLFGVFIVLKKNYKRFTWYRSGKIGFASTITLGLLFFFRLVASLLWDNMFSYSGLLELIPTAILSFICFFSLYNLSGK